MSWFNPFASISKVVQNDIAKPVENELGTVRNDFSKGYNGISQGVTRTANSVYKRMSSVVGGFEKSAVKGLSPIESDFGNFGKTASADINTSLRNVYTSAEMLGKSVVGGLTTAKNDVVSGLNDVKNGAVSIGKDIAGGFGDIFNWLKTFMIPIIIIIVLIVVVVIIAVI
jgi:hypothetical protein